MRKFSDIVSKQSGAPLGKEKLEGAPKNTEANAVKGEKPKKLVKRFFFHKKNSSNTFLKVKAKKATKSTEALAKIRYWLLAALVFLMPLWFLPWGSDAIGMAKQLLLGVLGGISLILWLYESLAAGKLSYRKSWINAGVAVLLTVLALGTAFSLSPKVSFYVASANFANFWNVLLLGIFYLMLIADTRQKKHRNSLLDLFLASTGLMVLIALLRVLGVNFLPAGILNPIGSTTSVGILAGLALLISLSKNIEIEESLKSKTKIAFRMLYGSITVISLVFLFLANFRVVWYGLILGLALMISLKIAKERTSNIKRFILPLSLLVLVVTWLFLGQIAPKIGIFQPQTRLKSIPIEVVPSFSASFGIARKTLTATSVPNSSAQQNEQTSATSSQSGLEKVSTSDDIKRLLFGSGLGSFDKMWMRYRPKSINPSDFWQVRFSQGNSSFTTWLVETGTLGTSAILLVFLLGVAYGIRQIRGTKSEAELLTSRQAKKAANIQYCLIALAYLLMMWFLYPFNLTLYFVLFLVLGLLSREGGKRRVIKFTQPVQKALIFSLTLIFLMVASVFAVYFEGQRYAASVYIKTAQSLRFTPTANNNQKKLSAKETQEKLLKEYDAYLNQKINLLAKAYSMDSQNDSILRELTQLYLAKLNLKLQQALSGQKTDIKALTQKILLIANRALSIDKTEPLNWANLAGVYEALIPFSQGALDIALKDYEKALELQGSNNPALIVGKARSQIAEANRLANAMKAQAKTSKKEDIAKLQAQQKSLLESALKNLKEAVKVKPNYAPAYLLMTQIYESQGAQDEAIKSTISLINLDPQNAALWLRLGLLYYQKQDLKSAEIALSQAVKINDNYSNARYFLGLVYDQQGKKDKALGEFEKIAKLNPKNGTIQQIISNLKAGKPALEGISQQQQ